MPKIGGNPVINNKRYDIETGDIWICFASLEEHSSIPISNEKRIVLSVGALVNQKHAQNIYQKMNK